MEIMGRLHARWRIAIMVPLVYLGLGTFAVETVFDGSKGRPGLMPMSEEAFGLGCLFGGLLLGALWVTINRLKGREFEELSGVADDPPEFLRLAQRHQFTQFTVCDLAASPGIFLFLLQGELVALFLFVVASEVFYLRAFPSDKRLGEAMFRAGVR